MALGIDWCITEDQRKADRERIRERERYQELVNEREN